MLPLATEMLHYALDHGVNYVDTAFPYHGASFDGTPGNSEGFIGDALRDGGYRDKVLLATKLPPWVVKSREDMDSILNGQLERLRTDHIDCYLVHGIGDKAWAKMAELGVVGLPGQGQGRRPHPLRRILVPRRRSGFRAHRRRVRLGFLPDPVQLPGRRLPGGRRRTCLRCRAKAWPSWSWSRSRGEAGTADAGLHPGRSGTHTRSSALRRTGPSASCGTILG